MVFSISSFLPMTVASSNGPADFVSQLKTDED